MFQREWILSGRIDRYLTGPNVLWPDDYPEESDLIIKLTKDLADGVVTRHFAETLARKWERLEKGNIDSVLN